MSVVKDKREKIIFAALELFAEKGYKKTSIAEICSKAGVNIASVNYYFRSKANLYREIFKKAFEVAEDKMPLLNLSSLDISYKEKLRRFIETVVKRGCATDELRFLPQLFLHESMHSTGICDDILSEIKAKYRSTLFDIIKGITGINDTDKIQLLGYSIMSQCLFLKINPLAQKEIIKNKNSAEQIDMLINHIYKFCISGLKNYKRFE
ncbi:TetR/AcrR family transcriptional regulator [Deferribacter thermophilus]|uniref:TetR/AcrR family transcriptional regulator n=1 Tax=Deferribacter thermophilus TaxID=53573 RepID=UPI003C20CE21